MIHGASFSCLRNKAKKVGQYHNYEKLEDLLFDCRNENHINFKIYFG